jgi:hypothetical protein
MTPYIEKNPSQKRGGGVAQGIGLSSNSSTTKKKKKRMASLYESHSIIVLFSFLEKGMKYCLLQVTT